MESKQVEIRVANLDCEHDAAIERGLAESAGFRLQATHGPWYFFTRNFVKA